MDNIKKGLSYCSQLGETRISVPLMQEIRDYKGFWKGFEKGWLWSSWPDSLKWGVEVIAIASIAILVAVFTPWRKVSQYLPIGNSNVILVEVQKNNKIKSDKVSGLTSLKGKMPLSLIPEIPESSLKSTPLKVKKNKSTQALEDNKNKLLPTSPPKVKTAKGKSENKDEPKDIKTTEAKGAKEKKNEATLVSKSKPLKGFIFRAFMKLTDLDQKTPNIAQEIKRLGGAKAGQVKLGWRKPKGSYFHFSLPESNYKKLLEMLRNFGPVRIYKDSHWKIMPKGKIRFILWIEESKNN